MAICLRECDSPACREFFMTKEGCGLLKQSIQNRSEQQPIYPAISSIGSEMDGCLYGLCLFTYGCAFAWCTVCTVCSVLKLWFVHEHCDKTKRQIPACFLTVKCVKERWVGVSAHYRQTQPISHPRGW